jgi:hypothetical protein
MKFPARSAQVLFPIGYSGPLSRVIRNSASQSCGDEVILTTGEFALEWRTASSMLLRALVMVTLGIEGFHRHEIVYASLSVPP